MIDWISIPGAKLSADTARKEFVLRITDDGGQPDSDLLDRAQRCGFSRVQEDGTILRAPFSWDVAREMRLWPGVERIQVDREDILHAPAGRHPAPAQPVPGGAQTPAGRHPAPAQPVSSGAQTPAGRQSAPAQPAPGGGEASVVFVGRNPNHFFLGNEIERVGGFSEKERFLENRAAIELLDKPDPLSAEEKSTLARFNGWGGLSGLFESRFTSPWQREAAQWIREHMSEEEIAAARHSTLNSHYTAPAVIRQIWSAVDTLAERAGWFEKGGVLRVLEPSMGVGGFLGLMPKRWVDRSRIVGVELDTIPARIAQKLYPDADIRACGFEEIRVPDGYFDLTITNVPFGNYSVHDPEFIGEGPLSIHDFFILKAIRKTAPGGLIAVITSAFTMNRANPHVREKIARHASLIGAVRLPDNSQTSQAGTRVTSDVLIFARHPVPHALAAIPPQDWINSRKERLHFYRAGAGDGVYLSVNEYFWNHPEQVLGETRAGRGIHGTYRVDVKARARDGEDWGALIGQRLIEPATRDVPSPDEAPPESDADAVGADAAQGEPDGDLTETSGTAFFIGPLGRVYRRFPDADDEGTHIDDPDDDAAPGIPVQLDGRALERMKGMICVRDAMHELIDLQIACAEDDEVGKAMARLNSVYDDFVKAHGPLNSAVNRRLFKDDPSSGRLAALEIVDSQTNAVSKADIFRTRIIRRAKPIDHVDTPIEGLSVVLADTGRVDFARIAELCNRPEPWVKKDLLDKRAVFRDPAKIGTEDEFVIAARYLSGAVREKLEIARTIAEMEPDAGWERNISALESVIPKDLGPGEISVSMSSTWLPADVLAQFTREKLNLRVDFSLDPMLHAWEVEPSGVQSIYAHENTNVWGTPKRSAIDIIDRLCSNKSLSVYDRVDNGEKTTSVLNQHETTLVEEKAGAIQEAFFSWIWADPGRTERLVQIYNRRFNGYVAPKYDGSALTFPGMSASIRLRPHQKNAVMRAIQEGNTILAHEVGTGKTYAMIAAAMEMVRVGKATKVGIAVPNHMLEQIEREALQLYPNAKILVVGEGDLTKDRRKKFLGKAVNNRYDIVVMTHSMFGRIPVSPQFECRFLRSEVNQFDYWLKSNKNAKKATVKAVELRRARFSRRINERIAAEKKAKEKGVYIDDLGVDALFIDEAHNFKNLEADVGRSSELAAGIQGSQRAFDLYLKTKWLYDLRGSESGLVFATGTPVSNNLLELFNLQRYHQPGMLQSIGLDEVSSWASTFLAPKRRWEPDPGGNGFVLRTRFVLVNAPELLSMLRLNLDVVSSEDAGLDLPQMVTHNVVTDANDTQQEKMAELAERVFAIREKDVDPSEDNLLKIISEGRQLSLDPRLLDESMSSDPGTLKWEAMIENIVRIWKESREEKGVQIVFCDLGTPSDARKGRYNVYDAVRNALIERGIPAKEVAFIHEAKTTKAKGDLLARVRAGAVRVIMGSTMKMGEGTNMQTRARAIHHLDYPWRPSDIEQRDGRILRQGNSFDMVERYIYTTKGIGFDEFGWSTLKTKAEAFASILRGDPGVRVFDNDIDPSYAETVAITTGNPLLIEKLDVERELARAHALALGYDHEQWRTKMDINGMKDRLEEREGTLTYLKTLPKCKDNLWSMDASHLVFKDGKNPFKDGKDPGVFGVDRQSLLAFLRDLRDRVQDRKQLDRIDTILYGGVEVCLVQQTDAAGNRNGVWFPKGFGEMTFKRASDLENMLGARDERIRDIDSSIQFLREEIAKAESMLGGGENPHNDLVAKLTARMAEIERKIQEQAGASAPDHALEKDEQRFAVR